MSKVTNVKTTQLNGMKQQIESFLTVIPTMDGYVQEDYNSLFELESALENALDQIYYARKEAKNE